MKLHSPIVRILLASALLAGSGLALASGNHAGGHEAEESAIGRPGVAAKADRTITVEMSDAMRFTPSDMKVKRGETVRFVIKNVGQIKHEFNLGTHRELLEHLEVMKKYPNMEHDEPGKVTLDPGQQGEIVWQFNQPGTVDLACLIPGHYEAGMRGAIHVGKK